LPARDARRYRFAAHRGDPGDRGRIAGAGDGMSPVRTLRCRTVAEGRSRQMSHVRDLRPFPVDEPTGLSRPDPAPEPLEVLLSALGACIAVGVRASAVARGIALARLELEVEAEVALAPMDRLDAAPVALGFEAVRVLVHIEADASRDALAALVSRATLRSPVANTLHDGAELEVRLAQPG
jgi:uncharacterized OsmC-like protein